MKRWIILVALTCGNLNAAEEKPDKPQSVDPEIYRQAMEKLAAKSATQPTDIERLKKENSELRAKVASLRAIIAKLEKELGHPADARNANDAPSGASAEEIIKKAYKELNIPYSPAKTLEEYDVQTKMGASQIRVENRGLYLEDEMAFNLVRKVERDIMLAGLKDDAIRNSRPKDPKN